jgi:hypothetical protein
MEAKEEFMKKLVLSIFTCALVLTLLLGSFRVAKADPGDFPVVTPVSGDKVFSIKFEPLSSLPGTSESDHLFVPVGFPIGEVQFDGTGITVKGLDYGKATLCYSIRSIEIKQGWGGKVGVWNGTKWVLLPTTFTTPEEALNSTACATITGSGTYAFFKWIADTTLIPEGPTEGPIGPRTECGFNFGTFRAQYPNTWGTGGYNPSTRTFSLWFFSSQMPVGVPVTYSISGVTPDGAITGDLVGSTNVAVNYGYTSALFPAIVMWSSGTEPSFYAHLVFPTLHCYQDLYFPFVTN